MSATAKFKVFCIEQYKFKHGLTGREAVSLFEQYGVFELFIKARQN